jgi:general secretion pathway protein H
MAILALTLVVMAPMVMKGGSGIGLAAAARDVAAGLRLARSEAIAQNREVTFELDVAARSYRVAGATHTFDQGGNLSVELFTARSEQSGAERGAIRFFPDGGATGGGVTIGNGSHEYRILVDWLTGRISIVE